MNRNSGIVDAFKINSDLLEQFRAAAQTMDATLLSPLTADLHPADIAEVLSHLDKDEIAFIIEKLDDELAADVLMEADEDIRRVYLENSTPKRIAAELIENLDSDDAADVLNELSAEIREEVISELEDEEHILDIVDLLKYQEGTAGALMGKEMVVVNENWSVMHSVREMRRQAEEIDHIYTIYVIDDDDKLLGRLPLKKLLTTNLNARMADIYIPETHFVKTSTTQEDVTSTMEKYDLVALPVVDLAGRLVGRITIDDVVDVMREEAEKDYQLASGLSEDVEQTDSIWQQMRARLPWLVIGVAGSMLSAILIGGYEEAIKTLPALAFFIPLITATGGNVGVQSSAIIVQGLANKSLSTTGILPKLGKEFRQSILNGLLISVLALGLSVLAFNDLNLGITISLALFIVILFSSLTGTFIPLFLERMKIDPALATGPFITTMNDITGLFIYFIVGQIVYSTL